MLDLFKYWPLMLKAFDIIPRVQQAMREGKDVFSILKQFAPELIGMFESLGGGLFPELPKEEQTVAGTTMFDRDNVKRIQTEMNKRGHANPALDVDGLYGKATKAAVKDYQSKNSLDADGWAGPLTMAKLGLVK